MGAEPARPGMPLRGLGAAGAFAGGGGGCSERGRSGGAATSAAAWQSTRPAPSLPPHRGRWKRKRQRPAWVKPPQQADIFRGPAAATHGVRRYLSAASPDIKMGFTCPSRGARRALTRGRRQHRRRHPASGTSRSRGRGPRHPQRRPATPGRNHNKPCTGQVGGGRWVVGGPGGGGAGGLPACARARVRALGICNHATLVAPRVIHMGSAGNSLA